MQRSKSTSSGTTSEIKSVRKKPAPVEDEQARRLLAESSKLYYRIGEVSELTGVKAHVLRYWETEFRWMAPPKSRSKQRLYRKRDIEFVWLLKKLLWDQRYTIAGARQRIQELGLDEALTRSADAGSLDDVLAVSLEAPESADAAGDQGQAGDWVGIRVALESMQGELLALRGVLQQGL